MVQHAEATARQVEVSLGPVTGNWCSFATMYDTTAVTENIFSVPIGHGLEPVNAAYIYVIVPDIDRVDVQQQLHGQVLFVFRTKEWRWNGSERGCVF